MGGDRGRHFLGQAPTACPHDGAVGHEGVPLYRKERHQQASLLRHVLGPGAPAVVAQRMTPPCASGVAATAVWLAQAAYDERLLPSGELDTVRLAVLADALEEAGSADADVLSHLRGPGPHVRGCWAVDLILSRCS